MRTFLMQTSSVTLNFLEEIALKMARSQNISYPEAVARLNEHWSGSDFSDRDEVILHELPSYWAALIYFEEVEDWTPGADRSTWRVRPLPSQDSPLWTV